MSNYDYIRRTYGVDPVIGARVYHTETGKSGVIMRSRSNLHHVRVLFDGCRHPGYCHPTSLDYSPTLRQETKP